MYSKAEHFLYQPFLEEINIQVNEENPTSLLTANLHTYPVMMKALDKQTFDNWKQMLPSLIQWGIQSSAPFEIPSHWKSFSDCVRYFSTQNITHSYISAWDVMYFKKFMFPQSIISFWQDYWFYKTNRFLQLNFEGQNEALARTVYDIFQEVTFPDDIDRQFKNWGAKLITNLPYGFINEKSFGYPSRDNACIINVLQDIKLAIEYSWIHIAETIDFDEKPVPQKTRAIKYRAPTIKKQRFHFIKN